jgi:AAA domain/UvrD-like helicase C-terminal domain
VANKQLPLRHLSIRVPWHDTGWEGRVCSAPQHNGACLILKRIAETRDDQAELSRAGQSINHLQEDQWPCCIAERSAFMADFEYVRHENHPYQAAGYKSHQHFVRTPLRYPPYSAACIPYNWMFSSRLEELRDEYGLDIGPEYEPEVINQYDTPVETSWVQSRRNQLGLLDCFFDHIKPEKSLAFFYAKQVPFVDTPGRVLIGVGRVRNVGEPTEYRYSVKNPPLQALLWERMVQHSIRPDFKDGFLLPYHAALEFAKENPDFDPAEVVAMAPSERFDEFSYVTEHVSHDGAIDALLACAAALRRAEVLLPGNYQGQLKWIDGRLNELWTMRGPCPGLGAALCAFGVAYGTFVAREIETKLEPNADPWPLVEKAFANPGMHLSRESAVEFTDELCKTWKRLRESRRSLLKLLSRFSLSEAQAKGLYVEEERPKMGLSFTDDEILENPYRIYELTRLTAQPVSVRSIDHGVFPDRIIRDKHPLPEPSEVVSGTDTRRVRALSVSLLESASDKGDTLLPRSQIVQSLREWELRPKCEVTGDLMSVVEEGFDPEINLTTLGDGSPAYQLARLTEVAQVIRQTVFKRMKGKRHDLEVDWRELLDRPEYLGSIKGDDEEERELEARARQEKAAALKELAESRLSVLIGPAGTGKTTLLTVLCGQPDIAAGEVLLLAPTGKARVRMEQAAKAYNLQLQGQTIAQFLSSSKRYDGETGRYRLSTEPGKYVAGTVIVDEASMLTEEMLAALVDALKGHQRLILVGDPRQLPPIGSGRPFADIAAHLAPKDVETMFPRIGKGYAELTIPRRQGSTKRDDLRLAQWFSGRPLDPAADEVFTHIAKRTSSGHVRFERWDTPDELRERVYQVLARELRFSDADAVARFEESIGGKRKGEYIFFNRGNAKNVESWQILSPVRGMPHGVTAMNRWIHRTFRQATIDFARRDRYRKIPKPMGPEEVVYGDKVICIRNHPRRHVWPEGEAACYIANGEVGLVVGLFKSPKMNKAPSVLNVEFSSQPSFSYTFFAGDFGDETSPLLELAYALTVHKAQGSEFGTVILILPNPCRLLSRELLYTALTRQKERVIVLHQGDHASLKTFATDEFSESARRFTNLLDAPMPIQWRDRLFDQRLIHLTSRGEFVRSKSEVIIANHLHHPPDNASAIDYIYEKPLTLGGQTRYPDFTIEDEESGITYYWEHCGMLHVPEYERRWMEKLAWYENHGILPYEIGGGDNGVLIITRDSEKGAISSPEIERVIRDVILN